MTTISAAEETRIVDAVPKRLYVGGEWRDGARGSLPVEDPATGEVLCEVADADPGDARAALDAAVAAQEHWGASAPRERSDVLRAAFDELTARRDELALLMTLEMGKPVAESAAEVAYAADFLRWFSEEAMRIEGRFAVAPPGNGRVLTMKQPIGPCLLITPWNFPMAMGTRKIGPAIAAGCTMVVKPAKQTPLSMLALADDPGARRPAGRRPEPRHELVVGIRDGAADRRRAAAQALLHRIDRGRSQADGAGRRESPATLDGARWQRAVPRLRGCRPRRGGRRRDDRQDAQHRRGVHRGQPLPRRRVDRRRVHRAPRAPHG